MYRYIIFILPTWYYSHYDFTIDFMIPNSLIFCFQNGTDACSYQSSRWIQTPVCIQLATVFSLFPLTFYGFAGPANIDKMLAQKWNVTGQFQQGVFLQYQLKHIFTGRQLQHFPERIQAKNSDKLCMHQFVLLVSSLKLMNGKHFQYIYM